MDPSRDADDLAFSYTVQGAASVNFLHIDYVPNIGLSYHTQHSISAHDNKGVY
ncbi:hypothetical protein M404DRAFT_32208 [Pisolithus tinctorius Marx 270]|uniref:Uncharacterized protein n=1 Tax=Pisolithus tinctorius Marx 270 TaxID=870435 RepID=A0A0C3NPV1_PISTI|nr:hypothetical protein M404DRAFT_32208 [Pisolithus tinctorius Marx 270]